jgi:hypothetical protein
MAACQAVPIGIVVRIAIAAGDDHRLLAFKPGTPYPISHDVVVETGTVGHPTNDANQLGFDVARGIVKPKRFVIPVHTSGVIGERQGLTRQGGEHYSSAAAIVSQESFAIAASP